MFFASRASVTSAPVDMVDKRRRRQACPARPYKRIDCYLLFGPPGLKKFNTRRWQPVPGAKPCGISYRLRQHDILSTRLFNVYSIAHRQNIALGVDWVCHGLFKISTNLTPAQIVKVGNCEIVQVWVASMLLTRESGVREKMSEVCM